MFKKFSPREEGQGLVEYALILVLVAVVVIAVLLLLGPAVNQAFCKVANALEPGTCGVISNVEVTATPVGMAGNFDLDITVTVLEAVDVTVTVPGKPSKTKSCSSSCVFDFDDVPPGSFTVDASDGSSVTGTY